MLKLELEYRNKHVKLDTYILLNNKRVRCTKAPCGKVITEIAPVYGKRHRERVVGTRYIHLDQQIRSHMYKCCVCQLKVVGHVKSTVLAKQDDVATLFVRGVDGKRCRIDPVDRVNDTRYWGGNRYGTGESNVKSEDGILWHYNTIEAIRMPDGTIIDNSQCYAAGWAKCPITNARYRLPLTTLGKFVNDLRTDITDIRQAKGYGKDAIFKIRDNQDKVRQMFFIKCTYLDELPVFCDSIKDAYRILIPQEVRSAKQKRIDIMRCGEMWLVPLKGLSDSEVIDIASPKRIVTKEFELVNLAHEFDSSLQKTVYYDRHDDAYPSMDRRYSTLKDERLITRVDWHDIVTIEVDKRQYLDNDQHHKAHKTGYIDYSILERWFPLIGQTKLRAVVCKGHLIDTTAKYNKRTMLKKNTWYAVFKNNSIARW